MVKQDKLELDGKIVEVLPAGKFKVELKDMDTVILCYKSGKMKMSHISVIVDDRVKVEVSPYDMSQGRVVYRYNQNYWQAPVVPTENSDANVNKKPTKGKGQSQQFGYRWQKRKK